MTTATEGLACSSAFFAPPSFRTNYTRDGYRYCSSLMAEVKDLPTQRYLSVEFPGVVKNLDKALGTLGGASALLEAHEQKQGQIPLNFRPDDPWSHPIFLDRVLTCNFVLEVTESTDKQSGKSVVSGEIIGLIPCTYTFKGIADFQYLAPPSYEEPDPLQQQSLFEPSDGTSETFPPPIFSKSDQPHRWNFEPNPLFKLVKKVENGKEVELFMNRKTRLPASDALVNNLQFETTFIPSEPPKDVEPHVDLELLTKLENLFSQRKIVARSFLDWTFHTYTAAILTATLYRVAYQFSSGPWRSCWVKLGYDPRADPESRYQQTYDFRTERSKIRGEPTSEMFHRKRPSHRPARVSSKKNYVDIVEQEDRQRTNRRLESRFEKPPSLLHTQLWLPDLTSVPGIAEILSFPASDKCDKKFGWFTSKSHDKIRDTLRTYLEVLITQWDAEHGPEASQTAPMEEDDDFAPVETQPASSQSQAPVSDFLHQLGRRVIKEDMGMELDDDDEFSLLEDDDEE